MSTKILIKGKNIKTAGDLYDSSRRRGTATQTKSDLRTFEEIDNDSLLDYWKTADDVGMFPTFDFEDDYILMDNIEKQNARDQSVENFDGFENYIPEQDLLRISLRNRTIESMSYYKVTYGEDNNGRLGKRISKAKRFEKNEKARAAKPKTKGRIRIQRILTQKIIAQQLSPQQLDSLLLRQPKLDEVLFKISA